MGEKIDFIFRGIMQFPYFVGKYGFLELASLRAATKSYFPRNMEIALSSKNKSIFVHNFLEIFFEICSIVTVATICENGHIRPKWPHSSEMTTFGQNDNNRPKRPHSPKMAIFGQNGHNWPNWPHSAKIATICVNGHNRPKWPQSV